MSVGGHGAARRGATRSVIQASESKGLGGLGGLFKALVDPTNSRFQTRVAVLLLAFEATLLALIIERVPYTEIDWTAYMQEVTGYELGERNYVNLKGDTGPLVYPAGFVHLFSWLKALTRGGEVFLAQVVFAALYLATQAVVFAVYIRTEAIPAYVLVFLTLSRRLHSIFVLRLFNDCWAMFVAYVGVWLLQSRRVAGAILVFSVAVSIKMNVLLFAPGVLAVVVKMGDVGGLVRGVMAGVVWQVAVAVPFLRAYPWEYVARAFEFSRVFMYKWTVNWRFVSEEVFLSKQFAVFMMLLHLRLLWAFADRKWFLEEGGAWNAVRMFFKKQGGEMGVGGAVAGGAVAGGVKRRRRLELTNERIASMVFASNFLGILCARSLHYQFYSWYFHSIPFILMGSRVPIWCTLPVLAMIEWCWNVFPSTVQSSGVLLGCHLAMLYLAAVKPHRTRPETDNLNSSTFPGIGSSEGRV